MKYLSSLPCLLFLSVVSYCQYPDAATIKKNKIKIIILSGRSGTDYRLYDENGMVVKGAYEDENFKDPSWINRNYYNEKSLPDSIIGNDINDYYHYATDGSYKIISFDKKVSDTAFYGKDKKIICQSGSDGRTTKYVYNTRRQLIKSIYTSGSNVSVTVYVYNATGKLQSEKTSGADTYSSVYTYNKNGLLIKEDKDYGSGSIYPTIYSYKFRD